MPDEVLDEVALYYLGQAWFGASDVAEVLETMSRVEAGDPRGWTDAWRRTANRLLDLAETAEAEGHAFSAADAYLRASTYFRATLHRHPDPADPEIATFAQSAVDAYARYLDLSNSPCAPVEIPYEDTTLPGYFCTAPSDQPAATLIFHEGKDGWAEDGKFIVDAAMKRGYNVLLFDGPGIGRTIRLQGLPFRHDWEAVITPVVDYLVDQPEVDPARLGLIAVSLGGYLGPRAAAFEHRLSVLVANPGVMEWASVYEDALDQIDPNLIDLLAVDPDTFDATIEQVMQFSQFLEWGMLDSMWHHGVSKPSELIHEIRKFDLADLAADITANTLILDAEAETRGQATQLYDALECPKTYIEFTAAEAAQFHVQPGATAIHTARVFDWLDDNL